MKKVYINYLLTGCIAAKRSDLAFQTILKYSDPDYIPNKAQLKASPAPADNQTASMPQKGNGNGKKSLLGYQSYLTALTACGDSGEPLKALTILRIMYSKGLPMTTECWNCAISGVSNDIVELNPHAYFQTIAVMMTVHLTLHE